MQQNKLWEAFALSFLHCGFIFWKSMNDPLPLNPYWRNYFQRVTLWWLFSLNPEERNSLWTRKVKCLGAVGKSFTHGIDEVRPFGVGYVNVCRLNSRNHCFWQSWSPLLWLPIKHGKISSHCRPWQQTWEKLRGFDSATLSAKTMIYLASFTKITSIYNCVATSFFRCCCF